MVRNSLLVTALLISGLSAQTGYREPENIDFLDRETISEKVQELTRMRATELPSRVDHSHSPYMRPVFNQAGGSCGSASRISYMFSYEINNYRGLDGADSANMYPSHFTWLLTGQNSSKEGMAIFNGIPTIETYGGPLYSYELGGDVSWPTDANNQEYGWMQGYDKWRSAMNNRLEKTENIQFKTEEDLEYVKWWIYNHHDDESFNEGAVCGGGVASSGWTIKQIPEGEYRAGEYVVTAFGPTVDHGVTWSGYDDSIGFDLNSNGTIEEDERGAIIMLNSWGASWKNEGAVYIPYKLLFDNGRWSEHYYIRKEYTPTDVFRIKMEYSQRSNLKVSIGISSDSTATEPEKIVAAEHFNYAGNGEVPLLGKWSDGTVHSEAMEFGIDLSDLTGIGFDTRESFRYFLILETSDDATGSGSVQELEVIRYSNYSEDRLSYDSTVAGLIQSETVAINGTSNRIVIPVTVSGNSEKTPEYLYVPQSEMSVYSCNSEEGQSASWSIDGDESTYWHSRWSTGSDAYPHIITYEMDEAGSFSGFEYLPRQNHSNGRIGVYALYVSDSPDELGVLADSGTFANDASRKQSFFEAVSGKYVTLMNYEAANGDGNTCIADFKLFTKPTVVQETALSNGSIQSAQLNVVQQNRAITMTGVQGDLNLSLFDMKGRAIRKETLSTLNSTATVSLHGLAQGVYLVQASDVISTVVQKLVVR